MAFHPDQLKKSPLYPVLVLEDIVSGNNRRKLINITESLTFIFVCLFLAASILASTTTIDQNILAMLKIKTVGIILFNICLLIVFYCLDAYFKSYYYLSNVVNNKYGPNDMYTFTAGRVLYKSKNGDIVRGFLSSTVGKMVMVRAGIGLETVIKFLADRRGSPSSLELQTGRVFYFKDLVQLLMAENADFAKLMATDGLKADDLNRIVDWVIKDVEEGELRSRWWLPGNLEKIGSIGRDWAYGGTYSLDNYATDLLLDARALSTTSELSIRDKEISQIIAILSRSSETNSLVVGPAGETKMNIIWGLAREIKKGAVPPILEHKRVLLFNTSLFLASFKDRVSFEGELLKIYSEATAAGNIVLVIDNLSTIVSGAERLGSNFAGLLDPFLASSRLQTIALVDTENFHTVIESNGALMNRFEKVVADELTDTDVLSILISTIYKTENRFGVIFTYNALKEIVKSAKNYFADAELADKSEDLVGEVVPYVLSIGKRIISPEDILSMVKSKVDVPIGELSAEEKDKLSRIEEILHGQVVGQEKAISAIGNALRRARMGIRNVSRPIGSFLFLGPTGVGKTETAKALARSFFGSEEFMMRLDMSEYQGDDAINKLIGSFGDNKPGVLVSMLRDKQYGVLLLDEFEKTNKEVLNMFLQILDEGVFADMNGKKVNARNLIIIATSNAGANMIWDMVRADKDPADAQDEIINGLVQSSVYKPELLNRFDSVIIFHPLNKNELSQIAKMMLVKLAGRLSERGVELKVTDQLVATVASLGANEMFGARPMTRYIQDNVEQIVANEMISGKIASGATVELVPGENNILSAVVN